MSRFSRYLFPESTSVEGAGRLLDFGDCLTDYNYSDSPEEADEMAMRADWLAVAGDLRAAVRQFAKDNPACLSRQTTRQRVR